jgi:glucose/arabinose dehydrogenase
MYFSNSSINKNLGPTAISFVNSTRLGKLYQNDLFVGDISNCSLYHFDLNKKRTDLDLRGPLTDRVVNNDREIKSELVLSGLGKITDIETGDDGYLYFSTIGLSPEDQVKFPSSDGTIYRLKALGK